MNRDQPQDVAAIATPAPLHPLLGRRRMLEVLFGAGGLGLRALATGLPASFLANPLRRAEAQDYACADKAKAQYLILSTSRAGDPVNANVPGTYDFPDIVHAADPSMAATTFNVGGKPVKAAQIWSTLPAGVLDRTAFIHHATLTNSHNNLAKVLRAMGDTERQEMLASIYAKHLAPCLGTIQTEPVSAGAGSFMTFNGRALPNLPPRGLRDLLARPASPLTMLQPLRDQSLDEINALLKARGTEAQRRYLDSLALSRGQARALSSDLLDLLSTITSDNEAGQITAAVALIKMNVAPVITIRIDFGGDNHTDADLMRAEVPQHIEGVGFIGQLMTELQAAGLADRVTFAMVNTFGRTLSSTGLVGRNHWGSHHATIMIGKHVRGGVYGGIEKGPKDYNAQAIDSATGRGVPAGGGDIPFEQTLAAMGKTLGAALGLSSAALDRYVKTGKIIAPAVA